MSLLEMGFLTVKPNTSVSHVFSPTMVQIFWVLGAQKKGIFHGRTFFFTFSTITFFAAKTEDSNLPRGGSLRGFTTY